MPGPHDVPPHGRAAARQQRLYALLYHFGVRPWEIDATPSVLVARLGTSPAARRGAALDLGCGSGTHALCAARNGWRVVGIDFVPRAIARARARAAAAQVDVRFLVGDVTRLSK
ncbi:MAG: methyltransferase domain-containing protein [Chloroflexi bacterium]|nr:methyltransferase domain-containing protein [Chloroflexota bacterium]